MSVVYLIDKVFPLRVECKRDDCRPYGQGQDGYGRKIAMPYLCRIGARGPWRRMYCVIFSNAGSYYVMVKGVALYVRNYDIPEEVRK
jgi:hypothetical protein